VRFIRNTHSSTLMNNRKRIRLSCAQSVYKLKNQVLEWFVCDHEDNFPLIAAILASVSCRRMCLWIDMVLLFFFFLRSLFVVVNIFVRFTKYRYFVKKLLFHLRYTQECLPIIIPITSQCMLCAHYSVELDFGTKNWWCYAADKL
jgi:hypothetical protein